MEMEIHLVQMAIARGDPPRNRSKVETLTAPLQGKKGELSLIVLPELFSTGFAAQGLADQGREDKQFLATLARERGCWVAGTTLEAADSRSGERGNQPFQNVSLLFNPEGEIKAHYQKIHPFSFGGEDRLFAGGHEIVTAALADWTVQPTLCYDLRFPELYRAGSARGADLLLVQANWPDARQGHWETLLKARAIENQAFVAGVNCLGTQGSLNFIGGSLIVSPKGEILARGGDAEGLITAVLDREDCVRWRKHFPALRDRLPLSFYGAEAEG